MPSQQPQAINRLKAPPDLVIAILRQNSSPRRFKTIADLLPDHVVDPALEAAYLVHLTELGILTRHKSTYTLSPWPVARIMEHLAVAGAISTLAVYQVALRAPSDSYDHLSKINDTIKAMSHVDRANLLEGAYLDYQFHLESVRISGNRAAIDAYRIVAPPALWLSAANYFDLEDALSSVQQHDNQVLHMRSGDAIRARDAAQYHFEDAMTQILAASSAGRESYP